MLKIKRILIVAMILEIIVFILVCKAIGFFAIFLLTVAAILFGLAILRHHGIQHLQMMQIKMQQGEPVSLIAAESSLILLAGLLLIIPGLLTDLVALVILWPWARNKIKQFLISKKIINPYKESEQDPNIIEGEFWRDDK